MARLKKRRSKWYARIRIWDNNIRKEREIQIPLNTKSRVAALERLSFINQYESDLRNGLSFTFPWESNVGQLNLKRFTFNDAINEWMDRRLKIGFRASTLEINQNGLDHFTDAVGGSCPLEAVTVKKIDAFVDSGKFKDDMDVFLKGLADTTPATDQERVVYPGLLEAESESERKISGIPYHVEVIEWFEQIASELGLNYSLRN